MLIVTRRPGQRIRINGDISITLVDVDPRGVIRLGIEAPADVRIDRQEVHEAHLRAQTTKESPA